MKVKKLQKKIASVAIYITGIKSFNNKLYKYNELLAESSKHQININETLRHNNDEVLGLKKDIEKRLERICADKLFQRCKYSKDIETAKDQLQIRIDSLSTNLEITWCQVNEANVILEGELKYMVVERYRAVSSMENSFEYHNTNQVSAEIIKSENNQHKQ